MLIGIWKVFEEVEDKTTLLEVVIYITAQIAQIWRPARSEDNLPASEGRSGVGVTISLQAWRGGLLTEDRDCS